MHCSERRYQHKCNVFGRSRGPRAHPENKFAQSASSAASRILGWPPMPSWAQRAPSPGTVIAVVAVVVVVGGVGV
eukprot:7007002-Pyramimonas_sp.AAC.1